MATISLTVFVGWVFVEEITGIIYSDIVGISWMAYSYFEGLILFFLSILILLVIVFDIVGVFLIIVVFIYTLGGSILRRVVPFLRFGIDDRRVGRDVVDVYYLDFLIGIVLNKMTLLSVP